MVLRQILIGILFLFTNWTHGSSLGEQDFDLYYGPSTPEFEVDSENQIHFTDEVHKKQLVDSSIQSEVFELRRFFSDDFAMALYCPNENFVEMYDYMRYLNRLLSISYLFEAIRKYEYAAIQFSSEKSCKVDWPKTFKTCSPRTDEMKIFLKNVNKTINQLDPLFVPLKESKKSYLNEWLKNIGKSRGIMQSRLSAECSGTRCKGMSIKKAPGLIKKVCDKDKSLLLNLCSETDQIFGMSYVPEVYPLLLRSSAFRAYEDGNLASGCLRRFINSGKRYEWKKNELKNIFSTFYSENIKAGVRYERGRLFPLGALKEFRQKGLDNVFAEFKKEQKKVLKTKKEKVKKLEPLKFETIELPKFKKKKRVVKKEVKKSEKPKEVIKRSSFYVASEFRREYGLFDVAVDMNKFKFDYVFTLDQEERFNPVVEKMSSIKTLKTMKKQDKVGTPKAPFPLKFLKYMIDKEMHQNLFNVIQVVGDKFYVKNDIDKDVSELEYIEIKNDMTTNFQWQILVRENTNQPQ